MTDQELADRIVGHGVGELIAGTNVYPHNSYVVPGTLFHIKAAEFVRDGRVVLAMMEKVWEDGERWRRLLHKLSSASSIYKGALPVAILTACVEALDEDKQ